MTETTRTGLATILAYEPVVKALELTDKQRTAIREKAADNSRVMLLFISEVRPAGEDSAEYTKVRQALTKLNDDKLVALLTAGQKDKLKDLIGEPFEGQLVPRAGTGGFGAAGTGGARVPPKGE